MYCIIKVQYKPFHTREIIHVYCFLVNTVVLQLWHVQCKAQVTLCFQHCLQLRLKCPLSPSMPCIIWPAGALGPLTGWRWPDTADGKAIRLTPELSAPGLWGLGPTLSEARVQNTDLSKYKDASLQLSHSTRPQQRQVNEELTLLLAACHF